jgi:hypothetical protein
MGQISSSWMPGDDHATEPAPKTQPTRPKEGKPITMPVPKRDEIERLLTRAAQAVKPEDGDSG